MLIHYIGSIEPKGGDHLVIHFEINYLFPAYELSFLLKKYSKIIITKFFTPLSSFNFLLHFWHWNFAAMISPYSFCLILTIDCLGLDLAFFC